MWNVKSKLIIGKNKASGEICCLATDSPFQKYIPLSPPEVLFLRVGRSYKTDELSDIKKRETWSFTQRSPRIVRGYTGSKGKDFLKPALGKHDSLRLIKVNSLFLVNYLIKFLLSWKVRILSQIRWELSI